MKYSDEMQDNLEKTVEISKNELKKSTTDWFKYIQEHPMQSILFGVVILFAIKGMMR
jgi:hypothetical protein